MTNDYPQLISLFEDKCRPSEVCEEAMEGQITTSTVLTHCPRCVTIGYMIDGSEISRANAQRLLMVLKRMMDEVTSILGMTFYQTKSWQDAANLIYEIEHGPWKEPSATLVARSSRQRPLPPRRIPQYNAEPMTLSSLIKFGTSTWAYEGWQGTVYTKEYPKGRFKKDCLAEYATYRYNDAPLFGTVGLDQTFYRPPTDQQLQDYAAQLPDGFEMCSKVWERITIPQFPNLPEYGAKAGLTNTDFLNAEIFLNEVLPPYKRSFKGHTGPFIFEFQRTGIEPDEFLKRLDNFLGKLPKDFRYSIEIRNPVILSPNYRFILQNHGVSHVYNHWTYMPGLMEQHKRLGEAFSTPFIVFRLLTPLRVKYAQAVRIAEPYNKIVAELPLMRRDTIELAKRAVAEHRRAYVLVNNRSEGSAPLTIRALTDQLRNAPDHA